MMMTKMLLAASWCKVEESGCYDDDTTVYNDDGRTVKCSNDEMRFLLLHDPSLCMLA